ncbi:phosphonate ABC transporter substrate-binding protein [Caldicellulosiruptor morganii]|uniref:Phosphonate ABC transporter substrate-binding protein n=1 Tax=Caldicellulosiruptor morganii TaxID=1387555 RepID=A0ABY7BMF5_9FIRM|nr:phosphonate ABC transporter substrate-binding protein [Caldicellulosiruptor morganii]WAM33487.1 phosphonate ABC transporter substrate-binding protein [Caldicellulosiruptor morganii]
MRKTGLSMLKFVTTIGILMSIMLAVVNLSVLASEAFQIRSKTVPLTSNQNKILIEFSDQLTKGKDFNNISVFMNNKKLKITKTLSGTKLLITINDKLQKKITYKVVIPAGALQNKKNITNKLIEFSFQLKDWPNIIRYGVIPYESQEKIAKTYKPLVDALSSYLGIKVEMYMATDYTAVIEAMRTKKIDVAEFGPFSYVIAHDRSGAEAFATPAKSPQKAYYYSLIIVNSKSDIKSLDDLKGKRFLFVDPASTSGNLFPRYMLAKHFGLSSSDQVDKIFSNVAFSGGHDASILAIARGDADAAGVASDTLEKMIKAGMIKEADIRIIKKSDPIPKDPVCYRKDLPRDLKDKIKEFFITFKDKKFFDELGVSGYYPMDDSSYNVIRNVIKTLNITPESILKKK